MVNRKIPKIRFRHFSDDWKSDKLGKLGTVAMNKRIFKEETSEVGEIPFYKIGSFGREPDSFITREKFEEYKSKYPYPEIGDILISASGSIGRTVEYLGEEAYFQDSNIVWLKHDERLDNSFLKQFYSIVKWQGIEGTTIKRLYNKNILETSIALPSISENPPSVPSSVPLTTFWLATRTISPTTNHSRRPCSPRCFQKLDKQFLRFVWMDLKGSGLKKN